MTQYNDEYDRAENYVACLECDVPNRYENHSCYACGAGL